MRTRRCFLNLVAKVLAWEEIDVSLEVSWRMAYSRYGCTSYRERPNLVGLLFCNQAAGVKQQRSLLKRLFFEKKAIDEKKLSRASIVLFKSFRLMFLVLQLSAKQRSYSHPQSGKSQNACRMDRLELETVANFLTLTSLWQQPHDR